MKLAAKHRMKNDKRRAFLSPRSYWIPTHKEKKLLKKVGYPVGAGGGGDKKAPFSRVVETNEEHKRQVSLFFPLDFLVLLRVRTHVVSKW